MKVQGQGDSMSEHRPSFHLTNQMVSLVSEISELTGRIGSLYIEKASSGVLSESRVRSVHTSLGVEGSRLSMGQAGLALKESRISADPSEILEVRNAFRAGEIMLRHDPLSEESPSWRTPS